MKKKKKKWVHYYFLKAKTIPFSSLFPFYTFHLFIWYPDTKQLRRIVINSWENNKGNGSYRLPVLKKKTFLFLHFKLFFFFTQQLFFFFQLYNFYRYQKILIVLSEILYSNSLLQIHNMSGNIKVVVRCRPLNARGNAQPETGWKKKNADTHICST